jgi:pimeloyl-ACP methyl ester carboxylesterase
MIIQRIPTLLGSVALFSALSLASFAVMPSTDQLLKDSDLKRLAQSFADYIEARVDEKGVSDATSDVAKNMEKLERKLAKTAAQGDILASPGDIGRAIWLSYDYGRTRPKRGKVAEKEFVGSVFSKDNPLAYAVWAPSKYSASAGPYPVIICIPDEGVRPADHLRDQWTEGSVQEGAILASPVMPADPEDWEGREGIGRVIVLMRAVYEEYGVDFDRIYLAGHGLGVATALGIAEKFPDRFAGVIGRSGDAGEVSPSNFSNLPTYFSGGGSQVTKFEEAIRLKGYDNCTVQPAGLTVDVWNWLGTVRRDSYPSQVTLIPGSPFPKRAYWLEVPPSEGGSGRIHAQVDRGTNTITVEGSGMTEFTLHFNDLLLDMNKPIVVVANGQKHEDLIPRSRAVVLASLFSGGCDPGRVFVNAKSYHLTHLATDSEDEGK